MISGPSQHKVRVPPLPPPIFPLNTGIHAVCIFHLERRNTKAVPDMKSKLQQHVKNLLITASLEGITNSYGIVEGKFSTMLFYLAC